MLKNELLKKVSKESGLTQKDVDLALSAFVNVVIETFNKDKEEKITLYNLGTFKVKNVAEKRGISSLGEKKEWVKPAHSELVFKVNSSVKELA